MKRTTILILSMVFIFALSFSAFGAANVTTKAANGKVVTITGLDADDWYSVYGGVNGLGTPGDIEIWAIMFFPSATDDRMVINDGGADEEELWDSGICADKYDTRVFYFPPGTKAKPYIDIDDRTGTAIKVKLYLR